MRTFFISFLITLFFLLPRASFAFTMSNDDFGVTKGKINFGPAPLDIVSENLSSEETTNNSFLSLVLSNNRIDFDGISPTEPLTRTFVTKVQTTTEDSYTIGVTVDHPFNTSTNATIQQTTCDTGMCTTTRNGIWENPLAYGFGIRCDKAKNIQCSNDFINSASYQQIPKGSLFNNITDFASGVTQGELAITSKLNVPATQEPGSYTNTVTVFVIPKL